MSEPYRDDVLSEQLGIPVYVDDRVPNDAVYILSWPDEAEEPA